MKIAVIGSGIAGLGAAWLLSRRHKVTVYERNAYAGGHSNTVDVPIEGGGSIPVDTGFIVYNERTYPNLIGLLDTLGVARIKTDMSFAVSADGGRLEYGGSDLRSLFAQKRNLVSPRFLRMIRDILRFYKTAPDLLANDGCAQLTLDDLLKRDGYSQSFIDDHLLPMAAAIWSCPVSTMGAFPAASFIRFFDNHGLLQVNDRPQWWTVKNGSRSYVERLRLGLASDIRTGCGVRAVQRGPDGVTVHLADGVSAHYDQVVFACHGDEAAALLSDQSAREASILSRFGYQRNKAILHRDPGQMPIRQKVWSSWNYLTERGNAQSESRVSVTYWMNNLQSLDPAHPLFVTLNPLRDISADQVVAEFDYDHPVFDHGAMAAQTRLPDIQGAGGVWFCGSYCGYGFHEDGLGSAVAVARALGVDAPWGHRPVHAMRAVLRDTETLPKPRTIPAAQIEAAA
ncbi:NAD(P)/FAD-dependent oxidoreductase [Pacificispira sp.]|uniref:NAD(P)/FAD-dependent oxidoreductase n=1 Tax=Pacificispira sp. TaxID=2888761 RepID=UPI003B52509B